MADVRSAQAVLDALPDAVIVVGTGAMIEQANLAAARLLATTSEQLVGRSAAEAVPLMDADGGSLWLRAPMGRKMSVGRGLPEREFTLELSSGVVPVAVRCSYEKDDAGVVVRAYCTLRDARARRGMDMRTVELISHVSHEIRSPLTSIKGFTKTLLDRWDRFDDEMKREMLTAVNTDADRVTRLLGELLDISRLEAGRLKLRPTRFDLRELAREVAGKIEPRADRHTITVRFARDVPKIFADRDKVEQVLTNLIENAVKYTAGGAIRVDGSVEDDFVVVAVKDSGEGIPDAHLAKIFRKFFTRARAGSPSGTGLGLYICKGLIETHGGQLTVASEEGRGATFQFTLPVAGPVAGPAQ